MIKNNLLDSVLVFGAFSICKCNCVLFETFIMFFGVSVALLDQLEV